MCSFWLFSKDETENLPYLSSSHVLGLGQFVKKETCTNTLSFNGDCAIVIDIITISLLGKIKLLVLYSSPIG